jgi:hypothetical protein
MCSTFYHNAYESELNFPLERSHGPMALRFWAQFTIDTCDINRIYYIFPEFFCF